MTKEQDEVLAARNDSAPMRAATRLGLLLLLAALTSCAAPRLPGKTAAAVEPPPPSTAGLGTVDYWRDVQPILENRCAVCHGCYDAPCQVNLSAYEGVARGASKKKVYDSTRLVTTEPTRLFDDAQSPPEWRKKGFYPILKEAAAPGSQESGGAPASKNAGGLTPEDRRKGLLARMLALKRAHPLPAAAPLPATFDFALDRNQQCPTEADFDDFAGRFPLWGMPYGLPALTEREQAILWRWIEDGAPYTEPAPPAPPYQDRIRDWERFLNGDAPKQRLMSRYLYEHLYLTGLYFPELGQDPAGRRFFRLVRSRRPPGEPIDLIATTRAYDDPGPGRFYYRLQPLHASVLAKTHIPYALGPGRMRRYKELFLDVPYDVSQLPGYTPSVASNPFIAFRDLPVASRYKFLLDDADVFVMQFIKGPVCRGQVALDVIEDRFWIYFVDPDSAAVASLGDFLARESQHLYLPTEEGASRLGLLSWIKYSRLQQDFLKAKQAYIETLKMDEEVPELRFVWDGRGRNPSASLTVFRHQDSASVVPGLVGAPPKTAWLVSYDLFERIFYLLVAGFDVYGFAGHQLDTRLYMDFLRMEGEFNFLVMLPKSMREQERDFWYRGAHQSVKDYVYGSRIHWDHESGIPYRTADPKSELFDLLRQRLTGTLSNHYALDGRPEEDPVVRTQLTALAGLTGKALAWLPDVIFLEVADEPPGGGPAEAGLRDDRVYTVIRNAGFSNIASLFDLESRRLPDEDSLTVLPGFLGAYPNAFYRVPREELAGFVQAVGALASEPDYRRLVAQYGVPRSHPDFWRQSDRFHAAYRRLAPIDWGLFDYNRLENR